MKLVDTSGGDLNAEFKEIVEHLEFLLNYLEEQFRPKYVFVIFSCGPKSSSFIVRPASNLKKDMALFPSTCEYNSPYLLDVVSNKTRFKSD